MQTLIRIALLADIIIVIVVGAMVCQGATAYNAPEVDDMTMHRFNAPRSLAEVVGQDRYQLATLTEKVDGIIRRGVVTRVRPTGEGFEYTFPDGVDAVYLVDVEIYNPGAQPVTLQGIESAIPVRPGHGVRVLIPGGDVTRGPIVMGRLTPAEPDRFAVNQINSTVAGEPPSVRGQYLSIGASSRLWGVRALASPHVFGKDSVKLVTTLPETPTGTDRYPESITVHGVIVVELESANPPTRSFTFSFPYSAVMYSERETVGGVNMLVYVGTIDETIPFDFNETLLDPADLTMDNPDDPFDVTISLVWETIDQTRRVNGNEYTNIRDWLRNNPPAGPVPNPVEFEIMTLSFTELGIGTH